ncbi:MAG TPA: hypothetical protein VNY05_35025 [Candidatus Acidoferrales bacterium]|nr:hypothetical protein [Candidatus Acidoferrales bacterium]
MRAAPNYARGSDQSRDGYGAGVPGGVLRSPQYRSVVSATWDKNVQVYPVWKQWQAFFGILNRHDVPRAI